MYYVFHVNHTMLAMLYALTFVEHIGECAGLNFRNLCTICVISPRGPFSRPATMGLLCGFDAKCVVRLMW